MTNNPFTLNIPKLQSRSLGVRLMMVGFLALLMGIPAAFVSGLISERTHRANEVTREIAGLVGGEQSFLGPVLVVPYRLTDRATNQSGIQVIYPAHGEAQVSTKTELRHRSLFKVPVYQADVDFRSEFDLATAASALPTGAVAEWDRAEIAVGVSDPRGALSDGSLTYNEKSSVLAPSRVLDCIRGEPQSLCFFGVQAAGISDASGKFNVKAALRFSGAQRLSVLAFAKTTSLSMKGDWASPSFDGGFSPVKRAVSPQGFDAEWSVPFIARGVPAEGGTETIQRLETAAFGVSFAQPADAYQSVDRSLKYVLLFLGLVFLTYLMFEVTTGKRVHPAQYLLVGMAQIIFYLLLLSIAERAGFDVAFGVAATATVGLISAYAGWVFRSRKQGLRAFGIFSLLYGLIYVMLRLEDQALLVGAVVSFMAVAAVMYLTRDMDWYGSEPSPSA